MRVLSLLRLPSLPAGRLAIVSVALAAYLAAAAGVPLPTFQAKDRSQPFPCMDRPCGCKDAAACWRSCCCTSPEERLAWATQRGIEPPSALLAVCGRKASSKPAEACCASGRPHSAASGSHSASHQATSAGRRTNKTAARVSRRKAGDFIVISAVRQCQGLSSLWSSLAVAVAPPPIVSYGFEWVPHGWLRLESESASSVRPSPAIPPPRA